MAAKLFTTGALIVGLVAATAPAALAADPSLDLVGPLSAYKIYVAENTDQLVSDTEALTAAIKAGDLDRAKALFAPTRTSYEKIEPIAELFADLDGSIDARADDYEKGEKDETFTGFHRIEYGLWETGSTRGLEGYADRLLADVKDLNSRINALTFPPEAVVGGAAALMEEVAATKISGEEDRYSHTDLWDLLRPLIADKDFVARVDGNFADAGKVLEKYRMSGGGFVSYEKLTDADRRILAAKVNTLAEDLSTLRGKLGLA
jgi:iron uptake system component EfeO